LGLFAMFSLDPSFYFMRPESSANVPRKLDSGLMPR
jgi:hypothetical protein